jgi:hypothetical protein
MVTHSPRDAEALPKPEDRAEAAGLMERCYTLVLGASSHHELAAVAARKPLTSEEIRLISSCPTRSAPPWTAPTSSTRPAARTS